MDKVEKSVKVRNQRCTVVLEDVAQGKQVTLRTPEHALSMTRSNLEALVDEFSSETRFLMAFTELKPGMQLPLRTVALRLMRQVMYDDVSKRFSK